MKRLDMAQAGLTKSAKPQYTIMLFFLLSTALIYGFFYHISSSEFWPISLSQAWFYSPRFDWSLLQKPLFSLFLSVFHLLPMQDSAHILLLKFIFSFLGISSLWLFIAALLKTHHDIYKTRFSQLHVSIITILILTLSPTMLNNFFRIRSDQFTFFLFALYFYFCSMFATKKEIFTAFLIPVVSIKSLIFLPLIYLYLNIDNQRTLVNYLKKHIFIVALSAATILLWVIAINFQAFNYFIETFEEFNFFTSYINNVHLKKFLVSEFFLITSSLVIAIFNLIDANTSQMKNYSLGSLFSIFLILIIPQSYPFFISSLLPFVYTPIIIAIYNIYSKNYTKFTNLKFVSIALAQIAFCYTIRIYSFHEVIYYSNLQQIKFIHYVSYWLKKNNLTYLDGMGTLPKQDMLNCFISPNDHISNNSCLEKINNSSADVIILTGRLAFLNNLIFASIEKNYTQLQPNVWIQKKYSYLLTSAELTPVKDLVPIFMFGFD